MRVVQKSAWDRKAEAKDGLRGNMRKARRQVLLWVKFFLKQGWRLRLVDLLIKHNGNVNKLCLPCFDC